MIKGNKVYIFLWLVPSVMVPVYMNRSSPECASGDKSDSIKNSNSCSATALFQMLVPLMKCENIDMRDTIVNGLGYTNPIVFR